MGVGQFLFYMPKSVFIASAKGHLDKANRALALSHKANQRPDSDDPVVANVCQSHCIYALEHLASAVNDIITELESKVG